MKAEKGAATTGGKAAGKAGEKCAEETASLVTKGLKKAGEFVVDHPIAAIVIVLVLLLLILIPAFFGLFSLSFGGVVSGGVSSSFVNIKSLLSLRS